MSINEVDLFGDSAAGTNLQGLDLGRPDPVANNANQEPVPGVNSAYMTMLQQALKPVDYDKQSALYNQRLQGLYQDAPAPNFYDLMSDLGAGILSQPMDAGPYTGMAAGFRTFSERMRQDKFERRKQRQSIALEAAKLAMDDERKAEERIQTFAMDMIKNQSIDEPDLITLSYNEKDESGEFTGKKITRSFDKNISAKKIRQILAQQGGTVVSDLPDASDESELDKVLAKNLGKDITLLGEIEDVAIAAGDNVLNAERIAGDLGPKGFGVGQQLSLPLRQFANSIAPWMNIDTSKLSRQEALATVTMGFVMSNVALTKGAVSDKEMALFQAAAPYLGQTYEGFMFSLDLQKRANAKKTEYVREYRLELDRLTKEYADNGLMLKGSAASNHMNNWKSSWREQQRGAFLTKGDRENIAKYRKEAVAAGLSGDYSKMEEDFETRRNAFLLKNSQANNQAAGGGKSKIQVMRESILRDFDNGDLTEAQRDLLLDRLENS